MALSEAHISASEVRLSPLQVRKDFSGSLIWNMLVHGVTADSAHKTFPKPDMCGIASCS